MGAGWVSLSLWLSCTRPRLPCKRPREASERLLAERVASGPRRRTSRRPSLALALRPVEARSRLPHATALTAHNRLVRQRRGATGDTTPPPQEPRLPPAAAATQWASQRWPGTAASCTRTVQATPTSTRRRRSRPAAPLLPSLPPRPVHLRPTLPSPRRRAQRARRRRSQVDLYTMRRRSRARRARRRRSCGEDGSASRKTDCAPGCGVRSGSYCGSSH